ncbi:hypothetical protein O0L34_g1777 [Tuta absoluta]|nr:hypothetical protein O0L34_g1777 [Tuta absoluta]
MTAPDTNLAMEGTVEGTAQPYLGWTGWRKRDRYQRRRTRIRLQELSDADDLAWRLSHPAPGQPDVLNGGGYYTPEQIRNFIRWGATIKLNYPYPPIITLPPNWPKGYQEALKIWPAETAPVKPVTRITAAHHIRDTPTSWWEGAGRGLPLGAALLAAILLILRAADRCLHTNLFKLPMRRRQSEEWPTPNVMATSLAARMTNEYTTTRPQSPSEHFTVSVDLPPPYSECLAHGTTTGARQKPESEEPPPPYSACYVAYSNPKDGQPSVHFFTNQCQNLFANYEAGPSNVHDTGQGGVDVQDSDSEERSHRAYQSDTTEDREDDEVEIFNNEATVQNAVDSEAEIEEITSVARDRYVVV